jgi:hypothetical protein
MNKKSFFYCCGCLVVGLAVGYFYARVSAGSVVANTFALLNFTDLGETDERAFQAYQHDSAPVGIYALTEVLDKQTKAAQFGGKPFMNRRMISIDLMLTHARLAKLYDESGQTNLSEQHVVEALNCAKEWSPFITNKIILMDIVAKIDKGAK